ncbi:MAG TPA: hypothetical protein VMU22_10940 [Rhizomicrobium sp.]|nr:hypothetical protein [Rhizomicrobium sp.]
MTFGSIGESFDRPKRGARIGWLIRLAAFVVGVGAGAIWLGVVLTPKPWWVGSGFASDPGYFIRKNAIAYPICQPWQASARTQHVSWMFTDGALAPGKQADLALLLPKQAEIVRVDCGTGAALKECSMRNGCEPPITVMLDDDLYTRGRAIEISAVNKARAKTRGAVVGFRVLWRERVAIAAKK